MDAQFDNQQDENIDRIVEMLVKSKKVFVITGAGISADSGLPVYRGIGGLYNDENTEDGIPIEEALSATVFKSRPELTWKYMAQIEAGARNTKFNRGHEVLAEMERYFEQFWILTQNIDGFHSFAGSKNVIEIHGNMYRLLCTVCKKAVRVKDYSGLAIPPVCECGRMQRPDVVFFEEALPTNELRELHLQANVDYDLIISIGTSANFPYVAEPVMRSQRRGIATVEINPGVSNITSFVDVHLQTGAAAGLNEIWKRFNSQVNTGL